MMPRFPLQISCQHRKEKYKLLTFSFFFLGKVRNYGGKESRGQLLTLHTGSLENGNKRERFFSCIIFSNFFSSGEGGNLAACIFPFFPTLKRGEGKKIFLPVAAAAKLCQIFLTSTTVFPPSFFLPAGGNMSFRLKFPLVFHFGWKLDLGSRGGKNIPVTMFQLPAKILLKKCHLVFQQRCYWTRQLSSFVRDLDKGKS